MSGLLVVAGVEVRVMIKFELKITSRAFRFRIGPGFSDLALWPTIMTYFYDLLLLI